MTVSAVIKIKIGEKFPDMIIRHGKKWRMGDYAPTLAEIEKTKKHLELVASYHRYIIVKLIIKKGENTGEVIGYRVFYRIA